MPRTIRPIRAIPLLSEKDQARFWGKVALPDANGCMLWLAYVNPAGYGQFRHDERAYYAHRISYFLAYGSIPSGMELDHVRSRGCLHRHCVAPEHLEVVDRDENMRRTWRSHCKKGHPFDTKNTYVRKDTGVRQCRACRREHRQLWAERAASKPKEKSMSDESAERMLKPGEVARRFGVNAQTLARWARGGRITSVPLPSGHRRYRESDVNALLKRGDW